MFVSELFLKGWWLIYQVFFLDNSISQITDVRSILIYNIAYDFHNAVAALSNSAYETGSQSRALYVNKDIFLTVNLFVHNWLSYLMVNACTSNIYCTEQKKWVCTEWLVLNFQILPGQGTSIHKQHSYRF